MPFSRNDMLVILSVALSTFLGMVAMSGMNIALPIIVTDFNSTFGHVSWILNGYMLVMAGFIVVIGQLADSRGLRKTFLEGIALFTAASLFCYLSWDLNSLILARVVQAFGAAMFIASGPALIATQVSAENQGKGQSIVTAVSPLGAALGIGLGGLITGFVGWRVVFLILLPLGFFIYLLGRRILYETTIPGRKTPFSIISSILLFTGLVCFLASCTLVSIPSSGVQFPLILLFGSFLCGFLFLLHQRTSRQPMISGFLFRNPAFSSAVLASFLVYLLYAGVNYFIPIILNSSLHLSPEESGLYLMVIAIIAGLFSLPAGMMADRFGSRIVCILATVVIILSFIAFISIPRHTALFILCFFIFRSSFMFFASPSTKQILDNCPDDQKGSGSGIMQTTRYSAYAIGISLVSFVFEQVAYLNGLVNDGTALVPRLTPGIARVSYIGVFLFCIGVGVLALICCLMTRDRKVSSGERRRDPLTETGDGVDTVY